MNEVIETGYESGGAAKQLNSTMFKYGTATTANSTESFTPVAVSGKIPETFAGDFNGDGLDDLFVAYYTQTGSYPKLYSEYKLYLRNSTGTGFITPTAQNSGTLPTTTYWNGSSGTLCSLYVELYVTDVDGNGKKDITIAKRGKSSPITNRLFGAYVLSGNAVADTFKTLTDYSSSMTAVFGDINVANYFLTGDFNGDNRTDWITSSGVDNDVYLHLPATSTFNKYISTTSVLFENELGCIIKTSTLLKVNDFDGDGKDDITYSGYSAYNSCSPNTLETNGACTLIKDGNEYVPIYIANNVAGTFLSFTKQTGDFNGDGKTDVFIQPVSGSPTIANIKYATGRHQSVNYPLTLGEAIDTQKIRLGTESFLIGDYNGDGKSDIAHYYLTGSTHYFALYYSNGLGFKRELSPFGYGTTFRPSATADFNGDGRADIIDTIPGTTGQIYVVYFKPKNQEFLLNKVKDGFARLTEFEYKLHVEPSGIYTYSNSTTNTYPLNTIVPKSFGVFKMRTPDGTGDMANRTSTEYSYANAIVHKAGKGYLGYKTIKVKDSLTTIVNEQTNDIINGNTNFYLFGSVGSKSYYSATPLILQAQQIPAYVIDDLGSKRFFAKTTNNIAHNFITGTHTYSSMSYDAYGNMLAKNDTIKGGTSVLQTSSTTVNTYLASGS